MLVCGRKAKARYVYRKNNGLVAVLKKCETRWQLRCMQTRPGERPAGPRISWCAALWPRTGASSVVAGGGPPSL